jgi:hypothetical protein
MRANDPDIPAQGRRSAADGAAFFDFKKLAQSFPQLRRVLAAVGADGMLDRGRQQLFLAFGEDGYGALHARNIAAINEFPDHVHPHARPGWPGIGNTDANKARLIPFQEKRVRPRPLRSISAGWPETMSARIFPEPQAMVQPRVPWPVLRNRFL